MRRGSKPTPPRGFTLLEVVVAMGVLALLMGMVFTTASRNVELGHMVVEKQNAESEQTAFFELLGEQFARLPGNTRMELVAEDSGVQYLSELTIQNVPMTFTWAGADRVAKAVQLVTERRRDGLLDIVLRYYENEILDETTEVGESTTLLDNEPFAEVVLLEDVYVFEWRLLDGRTMEWQYDWDLVGRLPLQMELVLVRTQYSEPIRQIFWITPKQNPEVMMRQLQQAGGGAVGGGGGGRGDDDDGGRGEGPGGDGDRPGRGGGNDRGGANRGGGNPPGGGGR